MARQRRRIAVEYHAAQGEWVDVPGEFRDDATLYVVYDALAAIQLEAWLKHREGTLPEWWRLMSCIRATGGQERDRITWPQIDAALKWAGLDVGEQEYEQNSWRLRTRGPRKGQPVQVTETQVTGTLVSVHDEPRPVPSATLIEVARAFAELGKPVAQ